MSMQIDEAEEYIGLLRVKQAAIQTVADADEQIGVVWNILDSDGIPEVSLSDEDGHNPSSDFHPPSSDFISMQYPHSDSDFKSDSPSSAPCSINGLYRVATSLAEETMHWFIYDELEGG